MQPVLNVTITTDLPLQPVKAARAPFPWLGKHSSSLERHIRNHAHIQFKNCNLDIRKVAKKIAAETNKTYDLDILAYFTAAVASE